MSCMYLALLLLVISSSVNAQTIPSGKGVEILSNTDYGGCNCDLTKGFCDLNCCCDPDCNFYDRGTFPCNSSSSSSSNSIQPWCVPSNSIFLTNTPYIISTMDDLLCVDRNRSSAINYYKVPDKQTSDSLKQLVDQVYGSTLSLADTPLYRSLNSTQPIYYSSDYVWINSNNSGTASLGYLTLPIQIGPNCRTGPPLFYMTNKQSSCYVDDTDINNECMQIDTTSLSLQYFYNTFTVIVNPLNQANALRDVKIISCRDENGALNTVDCATYLQPSLGSNQLCTHLIKSLTYVMRYSNPIGILEAGVDVTFFSHNISTTTNARFNQNFAIVFIPSSTALANYQTYYTAILSGNPGYLDGKPLQGGGTTFVNNGFTYQTANSDGSCPTDDSARTSINFNENVASECSLNAYSLGNFNQDTFCQTLQSTIDNIVLGYAADKRAKYYAPFATTPYANWASIDNAVPSSTASQTGGVCKSLRVGVSIEIAYARVGNVNNPQNEIAYVTYNWDRIVDIRLQCTSQFCTNLNSVLNVPIRTLVTFVDISDQPGHTSTTVKRPYVTLPKDFFYPLTSHSTTRHTLSSFKSISMLLISLVFILF